MVIFILKFNNLICQQTGSDTHLTYNIDYVAVGLSFCIKNYRLIFFLYSFYFT